MKIIAKGKLVFAFAVAAAIAGCGGISDVVRAGQGQYMVSAAGGIYEQDPSDIRQEVYKKANAYCDTRGKTMVPVNKQERPYQLGGHTASIELTFKCR